MGRVGNRGTGKGQEDRLGQAQSGRVQDSCRGQEHHEHGAGVVRAHQCEGLSSLPHRSPFLLQSSPSAHRGTSPGLSLRGAMGQVTLMAQRMSWASVTLHRPLSGDRSPVPVGGCSPLRVGQEGERLHQTARLLLCSAPAPRGSLSLFPNSRGWQELISLSVHPSLLVPPELPGPRDTVCRPPFTCGGGAGAPQQ